MELFEKIKIFTYSTLLLTGFGKHITNVHERRMLNQEGNGKCTEVKGLEATCMCRMV